MYTRWVEPQLRDALKDTPVVLLVGPRRAGKTTLVRSMAGDERTYLTLDDPTTHEFAAGDPVGFVRELDRATIDEVQRVPELLLAIKRSVDEDYRPGRFLLTGSANVMTLPRVADSLAGRMETVRLLPLARGELIGTRPDFLAALFEGELVTPAEPLVGEALIEAALTGGYPESVARATEPRRLAWGRSYLESVLTRDLRDIADIERLTDLPRFARLLALHSGQLVNYSKLGAGIAVTYKTAQRYLSLLEKIFLTSTLHAWSANEISRLVKAPKLHFVDSGLLSAARGLDLARLRRHRKEIGALLETFVYGEVLRLAAASSVRVNAYHFRDHDGNEVDVVLEREDGRVAGIEVKARASVTAADFVGLRKLAQPLGERFARGVVLYDGPTVLPFGAGMTAAPISCLWE